MTIEAVTFDLWDTLVETRNYRDYRLADVTRILKECGLDLSDEEINEAYRIGFEYSRITIPAEGYRHIETSEIVGKVLEQINHASEETCEKLVKVYEEAILYEPPPLKEGVKEALQSVYGCYKIGLISVTGVSPGRLVRGILKEHGILDYFDVLTFSDEVKIVKPNPKLFTTCLDELKVEPSKAVHVGDSFKSDIVGAIDTGMKTIWVKTREQEQRSGYIPDAVITSLKEFPETFKALE